jgi:hypothetical protein
MQESEKSSDNHREDMNMSNQPEHEIPQAITELSEKELEQVAGSRMQHGSREGIVIPPNSHRSNIYQGGGGYSIYQGGYPGGPE